MTIGTAIPMKATFFITYIMVDGWAGVAGEILRLKPLIIFHLKNFFLVKTEKDREAAMDPGSIGFDSNEPQIQLYFLVGLVYAAVTPFLLPFILIFFGFAYLVYRHQVRFFRHNGIFQLLDISNEYITSASAPHVLRP
jgi:calcium permeable stress-gated cation channel